MVLTGSRPSPTGGGRGTLGATGTAVTRVIINHRFAELGKVIGDPLAPPAILNGVAPGATIIPVKPPVLLGACQVVLEALTEDCDA